MKDWYRIVAVCTLYGFIVLSIRLSIHGSVGWLVDGVLCPGNISDHISMDQDAVTHSITFCSNWGNPGWHYDLTGGASLYKCSLHLRKVMGSNSHQINPSLPYVVLDIIMIDTILDIYSRNET